LDYVAKGTNKFKAGNPGKPKGAVSEKTKAWEELGDFICHAGAERYMNALVALEDDKFLEKYAYILEFFKPKLARSEVTGKDGKDLIPQPILGGITHEDKRTDIGV
jgi:hypothetical protein